MAARCRLGTSSPAARTSRRCPFEGRHLCRSRGLILRLGQVRPDPRRRGRRNVPVSRAIIAGDSSGLRPPRVRPVSISTWTASSPAAPPAVQASSVVRHGCDVRRADLDVVPCGKRSPAGGYREEDQDTGLRMPASRSASASSSDATHSRSAPAASKTRATGFRPWPYASALTTAFSSTFGPTSSRNTCEVVGQRGLVDLQPDAARQRPGARQRRSRSSIAHVGVCRELVAREGDLAPAGPTRARPHRRNETLDAHRHGRGDRRPDTRHRTAPLPGPGARRSDRPARRRYPLWPAQRSAKRAIQPIDRQAQRRPSAHP